MRPADGIPSTEARERASGSGRGLDQESRGNAGSAHKNEQETFFFHPAFKTWAVHDLAADKGPFSRALETGAADPGTPTADMNSPSYDWTPWNSLNHGGEGQNVLLADGSASWMFTPLAGTSQDNIYTRWSDPTGGGAQSPQVRVQGTPPTSNETPFSDTDSLIYP